MARPRPGSPPPSPATDLSSHRRQDSEDEGESRVTDDEFRTSTASLSVTRPGHSAPSPLFKFQVSRFALTLPLASPLVTPPSTPGSRRATLARVNVTVRGRTRHFRTVAFDPDRNAVLLIEQRLLPHEFRIVRTLGFRQTARAITDMVVRGAGAIGATAAYGLAQGARAFRGRGRAAFRRHLETVSQTLKAARPTAVDPVNAINQVRAAMRAGQTVEEQQALALAAAEEFANEDVCH